MPYSLTAPWDPLDAPLDPLGPPGPPQQPPMTPKQVSCSCPGGPGGPMKNQLATPYFGIAMAGPVSPKCTKTVFWGMKCILN